MAAWATTRMRKVYISQNTEIVVQKTHTAPEIKLSRIRNSPNNLVHSDMRVYL